MSTTRTAFDCLPVAVRAHTERATDNALETETKTKKWWPRENVRLLPQRTIVFDCETTTDHTQRLTFGSWRLFIDRQDGEPGSVCVEEGLFYGDDLPERDPDGYATLCTYVRKARAEVSSGNNPKLQLLSRAEFVDQVIWRWGYRQQATIVGFNLPFDLSRLAVHATPARGRNRGGISLRLWDHHGGEHQYRPRIVLRNIDRHRTLIQFTSTADRLLGHYRGRFLDLRTLSFAHTDARNLSLETAGTAFGAPEYVKRDVTHGEITADYLAYCREDVAATVDLFRAATREHRVHPVKLPARNAYSAATIGKAYWRIMGIGATNDRYGGDGIPAELMGRGMGAFFGGRAECRIRRHEVPVTYLDFRSMYMTCNALLGTWPLITADRLRLDDVTTGVQALLDLPRDELVERCFDPTFWTTLHTLVEIEPNGATLPVRARFDPAVPTWGVGVNPFRSKRSAWYALADVLAAVILDDTKPVIRQAHRLTPGGTATGLSRVRLSGQIAYNPADQDYFVEVVEQRHVAKANPKLTAEHRDRLDRFLKVLANATGFGVLAQYTATREPSPVPIDVHTDNGTFRTSTTAPEDPGDHCFPPLAAAITAAARLMLALLEHTVTKHGGTYAFCDTDSMAIVATEDGGPIDCPGGPTLLNHKPAITALSWSTVADIVARFETLNPYNPKIVGGSILRTESENYDDNGNQRELRCYAISAKRYMLATTTGDIVKRSEHGLGHLANPDPHGDTHWIDAAWTYLRNPDIEPDWLDLPALSRITVSSAEMLAWFNTLNRDRSYADRIKPANFLFLAHPDPLDPSPALPVAPHTSDPNDWSDLDWIDRSTGQPVRITTRTGDGTHHPDATRIRSIRDVLARYLAHPEAKALAPDGGPVTATTAGLLRRRPVEAITPLTYIGKEANDIEDRACGLNRDPEHCATYQRTDDRDFTQLVIPTLRTLRNTDIANRTGIGLRTVQRTLAGKCTPRTDARQRLSDCALDHARNQLNDTRRTEAARSVLYRYLHEATPELSEVDE